MHQLHKRYSSEGHLTKEWGEVTREMADISTGGQRATTYVTKLKESWQHLLRDRASRTLTYNDEQFHILEKIKMTETIRILVALLVTECTPSITSRTEALADWYKMASTIYLQTEILFKDLSVYQDDIAAFSLGLRHSQDRYLQLLKEISSRLREVSFPYQSFLTDVDGSLIRLGRNGKFPLQLQLLNHPATQGMLEEQSSPFLARR